VNSTAPGEHPALGREAADVVADWVATSGLAPPGDADLAVVELKETHEDPAASLADAVHGLTRRGVLLVVARVADHSSRQHTLRELEAWAPSRNGWELARFEDLGTEDGTGSWWRLTYRRGSGG
jgi:hypothetical protein